MGLFLGDEVPPDLAVGELHLGRQHQIRIDVIAGMDEEVRPGAQHGRIGAHAAARLVDPPALAGLVARPGERDRPPVARRGAKAAVGEPMVVFFLSRRHARGLFRASVK